MFKVGDLVTGINGNPYGLTNEKALCIVNSIVSDISMEVSIVLQELDGISCANFFYVETKYFVPCTYEKFMESHPNAIFRENWSLEKLKNVKIKEEEKMETIMNKKMIGGYELTKEERESLRKEIIKLLEDYEYNPTENGVDTIINEWVKNKGWMINLFKKHPNYNGKYQIAFDSDYQRICDKNIICDFVGYIRVVAQRLFYEEKKLGIFSFSECERNYSKLKDICSYLSYVREYGYLNITIDGKTYEDICREKDKWKEKYNKYKYSEEIKIIGGIPYDREKLNVYDKFYNISNLIFNYRTNIADEDFASEVNRNVPEIKAVAGQKVSRIVNKICHYFEIDKDGNYNRKFAKYSDTINPLSIKRHTILSCHPVDYLTMSFGNSWASCHTIDKENKRHMPDNYSGCYSSGTLSYMLDGSSFVYYTVDKEYNGNELELQDKINRNMFHMGEDKLIQARVYPQATDGETGIYRQIREIAQKVIADCLEVPNMWVNSKGTSACSSVIMSRGTHYRDYINFSDCNVSFLKYKEDNTYKNVEKIIVGHDPICPCCGQIHDEEETIECSSCYNNEDVCYDCGYHYDRDDMHFIDGHWYCEDCCFYCEYHGEYEVGEHTYVEDYGYVCDDALDLGEFYQCEECGYYYHREGIEAEDGVMFCSERCVERSNYTYTDDGRLYPEDEVYFCEHCERYVHADDWNDELECCTDCEDEVKEEKEEELEAV